MKKALIIGGGFAGCSAAHQLAMMGGWDVTLVEKAPFLGGGCKTMYRGGHPYTFGPRHFLTQKEWVWKYLSKHLEMRRCGEHQFLTYVGKEAAFYNFPIHMDDIQRMPDRDQILAEIEAAPGPQNEKNLEEYWINCVGPTLYEKYVKVYNQKMWMVDDNKKIDTFNWSAKGVTIKEGPRAAWDTAISAYPVPYNGYDDFFDLATTEAKVLLSTSIEAYDLPNKTVTLGGEKRRFDIIVNTIPPDVVMNNAYGELPFIGRDFHTFILPIETAFPDDIYFLYYADDARHAITRVVEYKKLTKYQSDTTLLGVEIPSLSNRLYPVPLSKWINVAKQYFAAMPDGVFSIGRAGSYSYEVDIDDAIDQAIKMRESLQ